MLPVVESILLQSTAKKCKHYNSSIRFLFQGPTTDFQGYHTEIVVSEMPTVVDLGLPQTEIVVSNLHVVVYLPYCGEHLPSNNQLGLVSKKTSPYNSATQRPQQNSNHTNNLLYATHILLFTSHAVWAHAIPKTTDIVIQFYLMTL